MTAPAHPGERAQSRRPYLLRAMHQWMSDSGLTPHVIVDAGRDGVAVPSAFIKDGKIVLNLSYSATQDLRLENPCIEFKARFAGVVHHVHVPMPAVLGIYARETGEGMVFNEAEPDTPPPAAPEGQALPPARPGRARLKVVK
ncbi:MAG TPA: ClpXP protease specificity-enhancing factor [Steroidobacteraceae bacterium]